MVKHNSYQYFCCDNIWNPGKKIKIKKLNGLEKISYAFIIIPLGQSDVSEGLQPIKEIPDIIQFFFRLF